jgi:hypothetical protein
MASTNSIDSPDSNPSINSPNSTLALNKAVANLDEQCTTWKSYLGSTDTIDRIATEHAVTELYESLGKLSGNLVRESVANGCNGDSFRKRDDFGCDKEVEQSSRTSATFRK